LSVLANYSRAISFN